MPKFPAKPWNLLSDIRTLSLVTAVLGSHMHGYHFGHQQLGRKLYESSMDLSHGGQNMFWLQVPGCGDLEVGVWVGKFSQGSISWKILKTLQYYVRG